MKRIVIFVRGNWVSVPMESDDEMKQILKSLSEAVDSGEDKPWLVMCTKLMGFLKLRRSEIDGWYIAAMPRDTGGELLEINRRIADSITQGPKLPGDEWKDEG